MKEDCEDQSGILESSGCILKSDSKFDIDIDLVIKENYEHQIENDISDFTHKESNSKDDEDINLLIKSDCETEIDTSGFIYTAADS